MSPPDKTQLRKRIVVGWRQVERRRLETRSRQQRPPPPQSKPQEG